MTTKYIFLYIVLILCFLSLTSISSAQTNITNITYPTCIKPCVSVFGNVLNITFIRPFKIDLGYGIVCDFIPLEDITLEKSRYIMTCPNIPYNFTMETPIPIPAKVLQGLNFTQIMGLKGENEGLKSTNFWLWVALIISIIVAGIFISYFIYNEFIQYYPRV